MPKNPSGFPKRLDLLMKGAGHSTRSLAALTGGRVSHGTIHNWLKDTTQAGEGEAEIVAQALGWEVKHLLYGHVPTDAATRIAELESALGVLRRTLKEALGATSLALGAALPEPPPEPERAARTPEHDPRQKPSATSRAEGRKR